MDRLLALSFCICFPTGAEARMSIATARPPIRREDAMRLMLTFTIRPKERDEAISRFKAAGGQLPEGVKLLSRWTAADLSGGFDLLDCEDVKALAKFS